MAVRRGWMTMMVLALLAGCASGPRFDMTGVDRTVTPALARAEPRAVAGRTVLWGGAIVHVTNLRDSTLLEVLAYPLDRSQRPDMDAKPLGRFIVGRSGYLEPVDYAPGREVTVLGVADGLRRGKVGESDYIYPVISARRIHLWPQYSDDSGSNVHFGVGVGVMVH